MAMQALLAQLNLGAASVPAYTPIGQMLANGDLAAGDNTTLAASINSVPFEPSQLGSRNVFEYTGSMTRLVSLESDGQVINVVPATAPGTPGIAAELKDRSVVTVTAPRIARTVRVTAPEVARYRALGSTELATVRTQADRKLINAVRDIRATLEYHRIGAVQGIVYDADGTTALQNYFTLLGVSQPTYDVTFGTAATGKFVKIGKQLLDLLEDALGNLSPSGKPPVAFCGRTFFEKFVTSADVVSAYQYFQATKQRVNPNRDDVRYEDFEHGGIIWRQYRGSTTNTGAFVNTNKAILVAEDVPGTYLGYFCPPDDIVDKVNTMGVPLYPTVKELDHQEGYEIRIQSNPVHAMTRPAAAIQLFTSN